MFKIKKIIVQRNPKNSHCQLSSEYRAQIRAHFSIAGANFDDIYIYIYICIYTEILKWNGKYVLKLKLWHNVEKQLDVQLYLTIPTNYVLKTTCKNSRCGTWSVREKEWKISQRLWQEKSRNVVALIIHLQN